LSVHANPRIYNYFKINDTTQRENERLSEMPEEVANIKAKVQELEHEVAKNKSDARLAEDAAVEYRTEIDRVDQERQAAITELSQCCLYCFVN